MSYNNVIPFDNKLRQMDEDAIIRGLKETYFPSEVYKSLLESLPKLFLEYMKNVYGYDPSNNKEVLINKVTYYIDNDSETKENWTSFESPLFNLPFTEIKGDSLVIHSACCPVPGLVETAKLMGEWETKRRQFENALGSELKICGKLKNFVEKFPNLKDAIMPFTGLEGKENLPVMIDMDEIVV